MKRKNIKKIKIIMDIINQLSKQEVPPQLAAGILPFFDNGKIILLGKEYRKRNSDYFWMEFGGKQEKNETLAEAACRETNEETAQTLNITLQQVQLAEQNGHYVDHYNKKTNVFYRMYCLKFEEKPLLESFTENALGKALEGKDDVGKINWDYFNTNDVLYHSNGILPNTNVKLYSTMQIRLEKLLEKEFLPRFLNG